MKVRQKIKQKRFNFGVILNIGLVFLIFGSVLYVCLFRIKPLSIDKEQNIESDDLSYDFCYDFEPPLVSEHQPELNCSISLNQSAYLPGSLMNVSLTLNNNFSTALSNVQIETTLTKSLEIVKGSLDYNFGSLSINDTIIRNIICRLPEENPSLDLVFLIDGSGSMNDEIMEVKAKVFDLCQELLEMVENVRIGFVFFGAMLYSENPYDDDKNVLDFTSNENKIEKFLDPFYGAGGWEPWGDALHYLQRMDWKSTIKMGILITDEPCNYGNYVGRYGGSSYSYYDGPELYAMAAQLKEMGIIICTMECYGWTSLEMLTYQLKKVAKITDGIYTELPNSTTLMEKVLGVCEKVIEEYGIRLTTDFKATFNSTLLCTNKYKWILIDNEPPSVSSVMVPVFTPSAGGYKIQYRINCQPYDAAGMSQVKLYYKYNSSSIYQVVKMNKTTNSQFTYLFPYQEKYTIIWYYFHAVDMLGNSLYTAPESFLVDFTIPELETNKYMMVSLARFECMVMKMNITQLDDYALVIQSTGKILYSFICYNGNANNLSLELNCWPYFGFISLKNFTGFGILSILNIRLSGLTLFRVTLAKITNHTISQTNISNTFSPESPVLLYKVKLNHTINQYFHCIAKTNDDFYFFSMAIFTESRILKTHVFHRICSDLSESGYYYIMVLYIDTRVNSIDANITINYGFIDDVPYWGEDVEGFSNDEAACAAYSIIMFPVVIFIALALAIIAIIGILRKQRGWRSKL